MVQLYFVPYLNLRTSKNRIPLFPLNSSKINLILRNKSIDSHVLIVNMAQNRIGKIIRVCQTLADNKESIIMSCSPR